MDAGCHLGAHLSYELQKLGLKNQIEVSRLVAIVYRLWDKNCKLLLNIIDSVNLTSGCLLLELNFFEMLSEFRLSLQELADIVLGKQRNACFVLC